jgi:hypothetical protein
MLAAAQAGPLAPLLLHFSIPKPKPQDDLDYLLEHPQLASPTCVKTLYAMCEEMRGKGQLLPAFMFFWKAKLLDACVAKGIQLFFADIRKEGGIEHFLATFEFPDWFLQCPQSLEIRELFQNLGGLQKQAFSDVSLSSQVAEDGSRSGTDDAAEPTLPERVKLWLQLRNEWHQTWKGKFQKAMEQLESKSQAHVAYLSSLCADSAGLDLLQSKYSGEGRAVLLRKLEAAKGTVLAALPLELLRFLEILAPELAALDNLTDSSQPTYWARIAKGVAEGKEAERAGVPELRKTLQERSRLPVFSFREFIGLLSAHQDDPIAVLLVLDSRDQALSDSFSLSLRKFRLQLLGYLLFASLHD